MRIVLAGGFNHLELAMNASNPARLSTDGLEPVPDTSTARKLGEGCSSDMRHGNCAQNGADSHLPVLTTASRLRRMPCELRRKEF